MTDCTIVHHSINAFVLGGLGLVITLGWELVQSSMCLCGVGDSEWGPGGCDFGDLGSKL